MNTERFACLFLGLQLLTLATASQASLITRQIDFLAPGWSGSYTFNTEGSNSTQFTPNTIFEVTDFEIVTPFATFDETEQDVPFPFRGLVVDSVGTGALFVSAIDTVTGYVLGSGFSGFDPILGNSFSVDSDDFSILGTSDVNLREPARVPLPAPVALLGIGLARLGLKRRIGASTQAFLQG